MKVAILLSGHVRTFENTHKNFYKKFINNLEDAGHEYDIYISTWTTDANNDLLGGVSEQLVEVALDVEELEKKLNEIYDPRKIEIEPTPSNNYEKFTKISNSLKKKYPNLNNKIKSPKHALLNSSKHIEGVLSQLYKIKKAYELVGNHDEYDVIVKYRFDVIVDDTVDWGDEEFIDGISTALYLKTKNKKYPDGTNSWGDTIVMGPPGFMKYFCLSYDYISDMNRELRLRNKPGGEVDIFTVTHVVNAVFASENIRDKLCLYTEGTYQPFSSYVLRKGGVK